MKNKIIFHKPYISNLDRKFVNYAIKKNTLSGRGMFTQKCEDIIFKEFKRFNLLTTSCTHALEIVGFLLNFKVGDEVIVPSYTFVSTANAFAIRGAKIVFADSYNNSPCIDPESIKKKITKNTRAICIVHYAGISCDMKKILDICKKNKLKLIEDCAHSFGSKYSGKKLGTFGDFSSLSFHATKNLTSGEGGCLLIKNKVDFKKAKLILEKGTNRTDFSEGKIQKYTWISKGSSYTPSDLNCSLLYAQLLKRDKILTKRLKIFNFYNLKLKNLLKFNTFSIPYVPSNVSVNGHIYYIVLKSPKVLKELINYGSKKGVSFQEHYQCLHLSPYNKKYGNKVKLKNSEKFAKNILRLPIYPDLKVKDLKRVVNTIEYFCKKI